MGRLAALAARCLCVLHLADSAVRRKWSHCLNGRFFVFLLWSTCMLAALEFGDASPGTYSSPEEAPYPPAQGVDPARSLCPVSCAPLAISAEDHEIVDMCWGATMMQVTEAWQTLQSPKSTLVAVLDTGVDGDNAHLTNRIDGGVALAGSSGTEDLCGHGTHVAGTIAAIAPNCRILNIKVADDRGFCNTASVARGIRLASDRGAAVVNLSLEVEPSPDLEAAVAYAWQRGAVIVAAAGMPSSPAAQLLGDGSALQPASPPCGVRPVYPACYTQVIAVTGVTASGQPAPASNLAPWVDVAAPGYRTYSDVPGGHGYLTGTSSAAAHVSGLAALLCGIAADRNGNGAVNDEVRRAIEATAVPLPGDGAGKGIVNAPAAVTWLASQQDGCFE